MNTVLVIAPHPDDEVLGVGGTILRHLDTGDAVHVVICTRGEESRFGTEQVARVQKEAREVHAFLDLTGSHFLDLPAAMLDTVPGADLEAAGTILTVRECGDAVDGACRPLDKTRRRRNRHVLRFAFG